MACRARRSRSRRGAQPAGRRGRADRSTRKFGGLSARRSRLSIACFDFSLALGFSLLRLCQAKAVAANLLHQAVLLQSLKELRQGSPGRMAFSQRFGHLTWAGGATQATEKMKDIVFGGCGFAAQDAAIVARKPAKHHQAAEARTTCRRKTPPQHFPPTWVCSS